MVSRNEGRLRFYWNSFCVFLRALCSFLDLIWSDIVLYVESSQVEALHKAFHVVGIAYDFHAFVSVGTGSRCSEIVLSDFHS